MPSVPRRMISILALSITCTTHHHHRPMYSDGIAAPFLRTHLRILGSNVKSLRQRISAHIPRYEDTGYHGLCHKQRCNKKQEVACTTLLFISLPQLCRSPVSNPPSSAPPKRRPWVQQSAVVRRMSATSNVLACLLWPPFGPQDGANATYIVGTVPLSPNARGPDDRVLTKPPSPISDTFALQSPAVLRQMRAGSCTI